jgi:hypothetical protein
MGYSKISIPSCGEKSSIVAKITKKEIPNSNYNTKYI